ncbi:MAG: single-stranded DNA-binding protein [Microthrixaceae bacterium]|nr:single-stranded DNA-binding protein [Microthrixaceae bacterium]
MSNGNTVTLIGNVTRDPELRFTPSGSAIATFGLAVNRRWQNRQTNEWEEQVSFFDIVCWRELGENVCESVSKGTRLIVTGRLEQRSWDSQEGEKRSKVEVIADEVGPSLRWASAQVTRNERREAEAPRGGSNSAPPRAEPPAGYDYDEEPF